MAVSRQNRKQRRAGERTRRAPDSLPPRQTLTAEADGASNWLVRLLPWAAVGLALIVLAAHELV